MPTIKHFMVPTDDIKRAKKFYAELFGWKIKKVPGHMEYYAIETNDESGETSVGGGLGMRKDPSEMIVNYIDVDSIDESIEKVKALGGKILMEKTFIPGAGFIALCMDTEKNTFGIMECEQGD